jgi:TolB-like protein
MPDCCRLSWQTLLGCAVLSLALVFSFSHSGKAQEGESAREGKIAVLPFVVHGSEQYHYLGKAVPEMFVSRLSQAQGYAMISPSKIEAFEIDPVKLNPDTVAVIGRQMEADLVLYGSLTMVLESWSLDVVMLDIKGERQLPSFSQSGKDVQALIPGIDAMAGDIRRTIEGEGQKEGDEVPAPYAGFEAAEPLRRDVKGVWAGPEIGRNITGLAAGDVNGDGMTETVLVDDDAVYIYRLEGGDFNLMETIEAPSNSACIAVDVADINGSGRAEIFVTAKNNQGNLLRSFVLEYRDGAYHRIVEKSPWFYRVAHDPDTGPFLLGQRHQMEADPYQEEIVRLKPANGGYVPADTFLKKGQDVNILGAATGFAPGAGQQEQVPRLISYDSQERLRLFDVKGGAIWTSRREYGGSTIYMLGRQKGRGETHERYYLPGRMLVHDPQGGSGVVFTFRNEGLLPAGLGSIRSYASGEIISLAWDGESLREQWKTKSYEGHFRDLCLADLNNDGHLELAALLIKSEGLMLFSRPKIQVLVFPLRN